MNLCWSSIQRTTCIQFQLNKLLEKKYNMGYEDLTFQMAISCGVVCAITGWLMIVIFDAVGIITLVPGGRTRYWGTTFEAFGVLVFMLIATVHTSLLVTMLLIGAHYPLFWILVIATASVILVRLKYGVPIDFW